MYIHSLQLRKNKSLVQLR